MHARSMVTAWPHPHVSVHVCKINGHCLAPSTGLCVCMQDQWPLLGSIHRSLCMYARSMATAWLHTQVSVYVCKINGHCLVPSTGLCVCMQDQWPLLGSIHRSLCMHARSMATAWPHPHVSVYACKINGHCLAPSTGLCVCMQDQWPLLGSIHRSLCMQARSMATAWTHPHVSVYACKINGHCLAPSTGLCVCMQDQWPLLGSIHRSLCMQARSMVTAWPHPQVSVYAGKINGHCLDPPTGLCVCMQDQWPLLGSIHRSLCMYARSMATAWPHPQVSVYVCKINGNCLAPSTGLCVCRQDQWPLLGPTHMSLCMYARSMATAWLHPQVSVYVCKINGHCLAPPTGL